MSNMCSKPDKINPLPECEADVIDNRTLGECRNWPKYPRPNYGPLVAKIPVVLSEFVVQICIKSDVRLEEPALDIKRIKKHVYLTQCKLIPKTNKLLIEGFIRKNIEYSTVECRPDNSCISGAIRHSTCKVPFECCTDVKFLRYPEFTKREPQKEVEIFDPELLGKRTDEQTFLDFEPFNEEVRCELVWAKIAEEEEEGRQTPVSGDSFENTFQTFTEKVVLLLKIKLLQDQQVFIPYCDLKDNKDAMTFKEYDPMEDVKEANEE
ncbi:CsxC family protein [Fonticella tunisiensis]|uniref:DUF7852 domain-containing protein n=1 Tax=Fonticella tunisiensis TaxID=1096341 RepID=A0A4R7KT58_9CLOT|nr:hypothetical protein [Fonticella tunisiensis]TDT61292.1 hypothetical protein EDD71_10717 [Fonticella tunisiensis]